MRKSAWILWGLVGIMFTGLSACEVEETTGCIINRRGADREVSSISGDCSNKNLDGVDLSQAEVEVHNWSNTICPDGTPSSQNNNTCAGHLSPKSDEEPDLGGPDTGTPDTGTPDIGMPDMDTPDLELPDMDTPDEGMPDLVEEDMPPAPCETPRDCFAQCILFDRQAVPLEPVEISLPDGEWQIDFWVFLVNQERGTEEIMTLLQMETANDVWFTFDLELSVIGSFTEGQLWSHTGVREDEPSYARVLDTLDGNGWHHIALDSSGVVFIDGLKAPTSTGGGGIGLGGPALDVTLRLGASASGLGFHGSMREFYLKPGLLPSSRLEPVIVQDMPESLPGVSWSLNPANGVPLAGRGGAPSITLGDANVGPCPRRRSQ